MKKNGVKVISATEAISSGAEGILLESMLEGHAEYYSAELAEKINRGLTENAFYQYGTTALRRAKLVVYHRLRSAKAQSCKKHHWPIAQKTIL